MKNLIFLLCICFSGALVISGCSDDSILNMGNPNPGNGNNGNGGSQGKDISYDVYLVDHCNNPDNCNDILGVGYAEQQLFVRFIGEIAVNVTLFEDLRDEKGDPLKLTQSPSFSVALGQGNTLDVFQFWIGAKVAEAGSGGKSISYGMRRSEEVTNQNTGTPDDFYFHLHGTYEIWRITKTKSLPREIIGEVDFELLDLRFILK